MLKGTNKNKYISTINHTDLSLRPIIPGGLRDCFLPCLSALGSWFSHHCFNTAAIILCGTKSLPFLCSSGWQGHNLFYDLLGRVAVLYSPLKDTFDNRSSETPLKKQDPAWHSFQHQCGHSCNKPKDTQPLPGGLCCFFGGPHAQ